MRGWPALSVLALAACTHRAPPPPTAATPHYVIGTAYQQGGVWSYPQEQFDYAATGLAERLPARTGLTADGEIADSTAMAGAHRTLQLPAIATVTNLSTGRQIRIRLDDRGPAKPGRLLGLTERAADLLGLPPSDPAQIRMELDSPASQALRDQLGGGPAITAAPIAAVTQERLAPPGQPKLARVASIASPEPTLTAPTKTLDRLPDTVVTVPAQPGQLWIRVAEFTQDRYAKQLQNKLIGVSAQIQRKGQGPRPTYLVMAGPFASVAAADAGLDRVRAAGVTDASIVVE